MVSISGLHLFWDIDSVPTSYYAGSESTLEYDRRKSVNLFCVVRIDVAQ